MNTLLTVLVASLLTYCGIGACWSAWWVCREGFREVLARREPLLWLIGGWALTFWLWPGLAMVVWNDWKLRRGVVGDARSSR